ncbi:MAG: Capsular polysaccharide export system inner membrane protein KpsE [uncultured Craurococcus sp.]|uniref:Capsular polysaccharide export system inner membrane protein KpsE n=1 Tax=uncultured Craurococcus sp. TaxID=1135998 RepID=A0A6J4JRD0_9PROT|nr:MAG: Capsular polysaccharide export system inner membrane protein KpsE [uncultured Craurococcus sp.]
MTIWTRRSPSTKLSEAAGTLDAAGWSGPVPQPGFGARLRRWARRHAFALTVILPTALAGIYLLGIAAPQYDSEARYLIRGRSAAAPSLGGLGDMMSGGALRPSAEDAMGIRDYLQSHDAVASLRGKLPLVEIFRRPEADPIARLWWEEPNAERLLDYFRRLVTVEYDTTSGITTLHVRSFRAEDSRGIATALLDLSEAMVNRLNERLQQDSLRVAREELARAEARLTAAQLAMSQFRERERAVDPTRSAAVAVETIGKLDGALAQARAELAEAQRFARADNPRLTTLRNRVEALDAQARAERERVSIGEAGLSQQIGDFERLSLERELARAQLASATASLEKARVDAQRQQLFLLRVVEPNLAEYARYPKATLTVLYIFLSLSVAYGLAWLLVAGMREHAA